MTSFSLSIGKTAIVSVCSNIHGAHSPNPIIVNGGSKQTYNKSDISCLKKQPGTFPVQYTQLSLGQANCSCRTT